MATDYRKLCIELFGTDNVAELRKIAGKQKTGRKKTLTDTDIQKIIEMQQQGITIPQGQLHNAYELYVPSESLHGNIC